VAPLLLYFDVLASLRVAAKGETGRYTLKSAVGSAQRRALVLGLLATFVLTTTAAQAATMIGPPRRLKACFVSLNDPQEVEAFRASLDPQRFELVDVRAAAAHQTQNDAPPMGAAEPWLMNACAAGTQCDLVIYSAEFAGSFFGKQGSLSLQEMEEASCQARCDGLFRRPREVFLLACNTLATKNEDSRSPEEYLHVLLSHGFDRPSAERVVELRYGPLGPSFREALRRVFAGVPRIYGFSSVAPRGEVTAPKISRYLRAQGDYASALERQGTATARNHALLASFKGTSLTQTDGLSPSEAGAADRQNICTLYDQKRSVTERLRIAYGLLMRPDALSFVPTLEVFLSRNPPERMTATERAIFLQIRGLNGTRDAVLDLVRRLKVSALRLELAHFAMLVGWLEHAEFRRLAVDSARQLLRQQFSSEVVDIMCNITKKEPLHSTFTDEDIAPGLYLEPEGLRLLSCVAPSDQRVSARIVPGLRSTDPLRRQWAAYTLTQLLPRDETILWQLVPYLRDPSPEVSSRIRTVFEQLQSLPPDIEPALRKVDPTLLRNRATRVAS
jgi:hypothetical protein